MAAGGDEDMGEVLADAVAEREGFDRGGAGIGGVDLEVSMRCRARPSGRASGRAGRRRARARARGEVADRRIGRGERGIAQIEHRREALDLAAEHAGGVVGLDAALGDDGQFADRPVDA